MRIINEDDNYLFYSIREGRMLCSIRILIGLVHNWCWEYSNEDRLTNDFNYSVLYKI